MYFKRLLRKFFRWVVYMLYRPTPFYYQGRMSSSSEFLLVFVPRDEMLQKVNVEFSSHFDSFCDSEWSKQLITNNFYLKHNITTPLLTPDAVQSWTLLAEPFSSPSIRSIECRTTLIGEQNCLKVYFHVILCPIDPYLLADIHPLTEGEPPASHIFQTSSGFGNESILADQERLRFQLLLD